MDEIYNQKNKEEHSFVTFFLANRLVLSCGKTISDAFTFKMTSRDAHATDTCLKNNYLKII